MVYLPQIYFSAWASETVVPVSRLLMVPNTAGIEGHILRAQKKYMNYYFESTHIQVQQLPVPIFNSSATNQLGHDLHHIHHK